jgi:hypothetical protein
MAETIPERFVAKSGPKNRVGKVFVDYLRNGFGATTACAWSARARPGLGVSVTCEWDELGAITAGDHWTIRNAHERIEERGDAWRDYARTQADDRQGDEGDRRRARRRLAPARVRSDRADAARHRQDDAGDVAGAHRRGEEDVRRRELLGLRRPLHLGVGAELGDFLGRRVGRIERRPDRPRRDRVDADALVDQVLRERLGERVDRPFRRRVVEQPRAALQARDRAGVDDRRALLQCGSAACAMWK